MATSSTAMEVGMDSPRARTLGARRRPQPPEPPAPPAPAAPVPVSVVLAAAGPRPASVVSMSPSSNAQDVASMLASDAENARTTSRRTDSSLPGRDRARNVQPLAHATAGSGPFVGGWHLYARRDS